MTRPVTKQASASCLHRRISYSKHWENFAPQFWMSATARNFGRGSSNDLGFGDPIMNAIRTLRACNWTRGLRTPVVYRAGYRKKTPTLYEPLCERRAIHWTRGYRLFPRFPEPEAMNVDKWIPGPSAGQEGDERYPDGLYQTGQQTRHANILFPPPHSLSPFHAQLNPASAGWRRYVNAQEQLRCAVSNQGCISLEDGRQICSNYWVVRYHAPT